MKGFKTGYYIPTAGKCLKTKVVKYRSSWERTFAELLDRSDYVVNWEYEQYYLTYQLNGHKHHYLVDFKVVLSNQQTYFIEIKPHAFYMRAMQLKDKNWFKWQSAINFCSKRGYIFKVITEQTLPILMRAWTQKRII